ncbi:DNA/RNA nuclease SfsA [Orbus mooreae]|uniref:DNA/RNA nuclease SfsA n=1 Tax=Orbus mooreae TaxID=3074107 RepID=UPI00370DC301
MFFSSQLQCGTLIKRYKRFLADIMLLDGSIITIHCANTGAMTGCANMGDRVWYSTSNNPKRKIPYSWELTETHDEYWICVNTHKANQIVKNSIEQHQIKELLNYEQIQSEIKYGNENSRIDLRLIDAKNNMCYVEIKSVTLFNPINQFGYFPDSVTTRGQKHLRELIWVAKQGKRAIVFFLVLHSGIKQFSPAIHIDPLYAKLLQEAQENGVEILCYNTNISTTTITCNQPISIIL